MGNSLSFGEENSATAAACYELIVPVTNWSVNHERGENSMGKGRDLNYSGRNPLTLREGLAEKSVVVILRHSNDAPIAQLDRATDF